MADVSSDATGGENPVNNQNLCGFCHHTHEIEDCLAAKICTGLMHHASLHMAKMVQETQNAASNQGEGSSESTSAEKVCLYCCAPGHDIFNCLMTRCVAIMICQLSGVGPKSPEPFAPKEPALEATNEVAPEAINETTNGTTKTTNKAVPETSNGTTNGTTNKPEDSEKKPNSETARPKGKGKKRRYRFGHRAFGKAAKAKAKADKVASTQAVTEGSETEVTEPLV